MERVLAIRIPLLETDSVDIIGEIDRGNVDLLKMVNERYDDVLLNVETGDRVSN